MLTVPADDFMFSGGGATHEWPCPLQVNPLDKAVNVQKQRGAMYQYFTKVRSGRLPCAEPAVRTFIIMEPHAPQRNHLEPFRAPET